MMEYLRNLWCLIAHRHRWHGIGRGDNLHMRCNVCDNGWVQPR
jgi:hypothetical protein